MKIGMCANSNVESIKATSDAGFDYVELRLNELTAMQRDQIADIKKASDDYGIPVEACNFFSPADVRLNEPNFSYDAIKDYGSRALEIAEFLGSDIVVIGSGKSRNIPDGFDKSLAMDTLKKSFTALGDIAKQHNITLAIEHLNTQESNIVTSFVEGVQLCRDVNHPNVKALADLFHMALESEDMSDIIKNKDVLSHVHVCNAIGYGKRGMPYIGDGFDYKPFTQAIQSAEYRGRISIEVFAVDIAKDGPVSLAFCRELFS